ncbi:glycoside hydrolase family 5 protein [Alteromonadaceae bacterium BrNp21-10]|nr:glycoside hydrolase family 5 protein [Alteromonadaceae bacterium BrNp21-10]
MFHKSLITKWLAVFSIGLMSLSVSAKTAVETHGALAVKGASIVNQQGKPVSFSGPSLFWSNNGWGADVFYNDSAINEAQEQWNATITRAAIGVEPKGGYLDKPEDNMRKAHVAIKAAIKQGMYIIVDWHAHHAEDHIPQAIDFFEQIAREYGEYPNIIYEIYNEPLNTADWSTVIKPYSQKLVAAIRAIDPDNLIVIGTQTWSQDVDKASLDPVTGYDNLVYTLHFYAGTHKQDLRDKAIVAMENGLALMVTEWGTVNANGDGGADVEETKRWVDFMRKYNLSNCNWALNHRDEGASMFKPKTNHTGPWAESDFTPSGLIVRDIIKSWDTTDYDGD